MERIEAISEGEWTCLNGMCAEEAEFMAQLLGNCSLPNEVQNDSNFPVSSTFWLSYENNPGVDEGAMYSSDEANSSTYSFSQGSSIHFPFPSHESYCPTDSRQVFVDNNDYTTMDYYCIMEDKNNSCRVYEPDETGRDNLNQDFRNDTIQSNNNKSEDVLQGKKMEVGKVLATPSPSESKKRSRIPGEFQRKKRSVKVPRVDESNEDKNNNDNAVVFRGQNSSSCCSEDSSNASHGVTSSSSSKGIWALNLDGKTRANRGSATDPQSLYARKRRERINERLRILQKLVPNGTKSKQVDISTMLEEAVQYVKFLQLQIKLLSSDEMWMYAPIAYNGMDI